MGKRFVANPHVFNCNLAPPRQHQRAASKTNVRLGVGRAQQEPKARKPRRALSARHVRLAVGAVDFGAEDPLHLGEGAHIAVGQRVGHTRQRPGLARGDARHQVAGHLVPPEHEVLRGARGALAHHHGLADGALQRLFGAQVQAPKPV